MAYIHLVANLYPQGNEGDKKHKYGRKEQHVAL